MIDGYDNHYDIHPGKKESFFLAPEFEGANRSGRVNKAIRQLLREQQTIEYTVRFENRQT